MRELAEGLAWLIAGAWVYKLIESATGFRRVADLREEPYDRQPEGEPSVVVIVPARNEANDVGDCLRSLLGQDYGAMRVIAVDDRSTDGTGAILDDLKARNSGELEVIHVSDLPSGWLGKTHAMAIAAKKATEMGQPEYLLFTDADVVFAESTIRRAVVYAQQSAADHCVLMPTTLAKGRGEAAVLAYLQMMSLWALRPWKVADPRAMRDAIGVGAFNLVRTEAYRQIGGFEATPMEVLEDLYLGRRIKWAGLRQRVAIGPGLAQLHWAPGAFGILHGTTKNIFATFRFRSGLLLAAAAWVALFSAGPIVMLFVPGARLAGCIALAAVCGMYGWSARGSRLSAWNAVFFPGVGFMVVYAMLRSMLVTLRNGGITWRGTLYPLNELRRNLTQRPAKIGADDRTSG